MIDPSELWMYAKREWFLSLLVLLFLFLSVVDPSLPGRSLKLIDYESLVAIISLIATSRGLELSGIFSRIALKIVKLSGGSEFKLLCTTVFIVSLSSAFITNDTAMLVFVPLVLTIQRITDIDLPKTVTLIALAANVGSALTPIGNPQNIIIWRTFKLSIFKFVISMLPYVLLWILILVTFIWVSSKKKLEITSIPKVKLNRRLLIVSSLLMMVNILLIEKGYSLLAFAVTITTLAIISREALFSFDTTLVAIFALIFIDFKEISFFIPFSMIKVTAIRIIIISAGLSQIISNVPATVMLLSRNNLPWLPVALGVNVGGTGIMTGSLANFIAVRISRIGVKDFHKYSLAYFFVILLTTLLIYAVCHKIEVI